jgi:hypothetical protein
MERTTMEPSSWPDDPVATAALVGRAIDDIDEQTEDDRASLLAALICASWGNVWAQWQ